jgi:hypothetical protein
LSRHRSVLQIFFGGADGVLPMLVLPVILVSSIAAGSLNRKACRLCVARDTMLANVVRLEIVDIGDTKPYLALQTCLHDGCWIGGVEPASRDCFECHALEDRISIRYLPDAPDTVEIKAVSCTAKRSRPW